MSDFDHDHALCVGTARHGTALRSRAAVRSSKGPAVRRDRKAGHVRSVHGWLPSSGALRLAELARRGCVAVPLGKCAHVFVTANSFNRTP